MSSQIVKPNLLFGLILAFISAVVFGIYPAAARVAYADGANIVFVLFLTTLIRTVMMSFFCIGTGKKLFDHKKNLKAALLGGFWQAVSVTCVMAGCFFIPGPLVLIILFTHTMMLLFYMGWKKETTLDLNTFLTTATALVGLSLVLNIWSEQSVESWIGILLAFGSAIATACRLYIFGKQMNDRNPAVVGAETFLITLLLILPLALWQFPVLPASSSGCFFSILAGLSLGFGSFGMFYGIALIGTFRWSFFAKIEPIFTALFSVWFLGEYLDLSQYIGMGVVITSLVTYQVLTHRKKRRLEALRASIEAGV